MYYLVDLKKVVKTLQSVEEQRLRAMHSRLKAFHLLHTHLIQEDEDQILQVNMHGDTLLHSLFIAA